ncbi:MAG: 50S ribosomal protein L35 [Thermomicrobiales bacterium]|nr:50S ribosomal protein L35 [Thermomicrobiales bacterium]MCO5222332.1 50S ribosomal protein L35 [Thermomicrobiales bacterium]
MAKQKLKTHKGAKRRFTFTATGKVMSAKGMKSHFRRRKAARVKRQFDRKIEVSDANVKRIKRMLPYGS